MNSFGTELGRLMEEKGFVQASLAEKIGVHQTYISKLVRGEQEKMAVGVMFKLCEALGVSCDHFKRYFLAPASTAPDTTPPAESPPAGGKKKAPKGGSGGKRK